MQNVHVSRLLVSVLGGLLATATTLVGATGTGPRREATQDLAEPQSIVDYQKVLDKQLVSTSFQGDSLHYGLVAGFSNIGTPITFKCAKACVMVVQAMVQVEQLSPYWAICPQIDGFDAISSCNWQGNTSTPSSAYTTGNGTYFWSLAAGKHTFQPQIYLSVAGGLDNWTMTIAEYQ